MGTPLDELRTAVLDLGGSECDLSLNGLDWDGWLHAFRLDMMIILCHVSPSGEQESVDAYAIYQAGDRAASFGGMEPVETDKLAGYADAGLPFPEYIGYWGEDFDGDTYVYFLNGDNNVDIAEEPKVILYDRTEETIRTVPLFSRLREDTDSSSAEAGSTSGQADRWRKLSLISPVSFSIEQGDPVTVCCKSGKDYNCDFVVWIGPYGYCLSGVENTSVSSDDAEVFLAQIDDTVAYEHPGGANAENILRLFMRINGTEYLFGTISGEKDLLIKSDYIFALADSGYQTPYREFEKCVRIVSPLKTVFGIDVWAMRTDAILTAAQTGGAVTECDKASGRIRYTDAHFSVWDNEYTFGWKYGDTVSDCTVTDWTVLTIRDFVDENDMLVTKDEFFRLTEQGYYWPAVDPEPIPCFIGKDAAGNALYVGEVPIFDPAC